MVIAMVLVCITEPFFVFERTYFEILTHDKQLERGAYLVKWRSLLDEFPVIAFR